MKEDKKAININEVGTAIINILEFFILHSTILIDGDSKTANVTYNGPNGWKISINSTFENKSISDNNIIDIK